MQLKSILGLSCAVTLGLVPTVVAQDPLPLYPENYRVIVENDRVRVLDFMLRKGGTEKSHAHPAHVVYVVAPFKIRFTFPDGRTAIREAKAGDVLFSEAVTHATENIGGTDAHGILVELKTSGLESAGKVADTADEWLTAVTFIRGAAGKEEAIKRELLSLTAPTRAEAGSIQYDLYQSTSRPNEFMRFEVWRNPEALDLHKASPYLKASFERRKDQGWMTEITLWKRVGQ
jgi:quinol monooxygenase YgiN/quercetin dioxygenase-like cupin family protein